MRFMTRSLLAIVLLSITLALLAVGGSQLRGAMEERAGRDARQRPARERVFTVNVDVARAADAVPVITAFGEVSAWRSLELRALTGGRLTRIAERFRDGDSVEQGALLFQVDPTQAQAEFDLARTRVLDAEAELIEARAALLLAQEELAAASDQLELREQALTRARDLKARGVGTDAAVETANLARSSAVQTEIARKQALAQANARIARAQISLEREQISEVEAERRLAETSIYAPFGGILSEVSAAQGRIVSGNEKLAELIDPQALEVAFRVSNTQFSRLIDEAGVLRPLPIVATLDLDTAPMSIAGTVDRVGATVGEGQTGRLIYATLSPSDARLLRPGDFLRVDITEPKLANVFTVPATAATSDGRMLVVGPEDRLIERRIEILRRQADSLIVAGLTEGDRYVMRMQPQLGAGVKVQAFSADAGLIEAEMVELTAERRDKLIAAVEANGFMPKDVKERILGQLREPKVPANMVARLESRMGGGGGGGGGRNGGGQGGGASGDGGATVTLAPDRKAALVAYVQANDRMPAEAKTRILEQLQADDVPASLVERLESRMGGARPSAVETAKAAEPTPAEDNVTLDDDRRARLVAFVEANERMPAEAKARILEQLRSAEVPKALVDRLEGRMGG